jgi:hypothetical protein
MECVMRIRDVEGEVIKNWKFEEYCVCGIIHMAQIDIWQQNITTCKQEYE